MPIGPEGEKRQAGVVGNAIFIARIATGEVEDAVPDHGKERPHRQWARTPCRAANMTPERRAEIARKAAETR